MRDLKKTCRVALVQAEPVMFDKAGGVKKLCAVFVTLLRKRQN